MARNKVKLAWIVNDATRRATLKKRRKGLIKKVRELSILCGVEACVVVYTPHENQPVAWPSLQEAVQMMARFKSMPEIERSRKMVNQEAFLHQRIAKLLEQLRRQQRENREIEMTWLTWEGFRGRSFDDLDVEDASALAWSVENKLKEVSDRREELLKRLAMAPPPPPMPVVPSATVTGMMPLPMERINTVNQGHAAEGSQRPNWLMDIMSPWSEEGQMYVDPISSWPDSLFP
ncbi:agamous-like MADS-box protein AGL80 [Musa acuminata AAA Group]|uniref:agamous-like MADS-box protein AGL80 n=1 Tax=Musa acuminata AAA Group TaxID=214697 RepID=UPI0031D5F6A5